MSEHPAKQQIVDKLKDSDTVLVTVSSNPSVDELSAALGFTLLLNKLNKHATAVFSGDVPPAITFLDPEKTFENTVDSLRDFIIALDKERADHLRYKVEGDMVKIFITPYRTTIGKEDFEFSQGDYNVEMVVAIGVESEADLDRALSDHGRILHDATVASLSVGDNKSQLGTINWHDDEASSYSEMLVSIAESLKGSKNPIDEQIATAFLTGIVAATERFSNTKTTSNAMTMAATLMAAGANQQLIATKLEEAQEREADQNDNSDDSSDDSSNGENENASDDRDDSREDQSNDSSMLKVHRDDESNQQNKSSETSKSGRNRKKNRQSGQDSQPESQEQPNPEPVKDTPAPDGSMSISHTMEGTVEEVADQVARENQASAAEHAEEKLADSLAKSQSANSVVPSVADLKKDLARASEEVDEAASEHRPAPALPPTEPVLPAPIAMPTPAVAPDTTDEPRMGGTLNATSEQAADDKRRELESDRNKTILSHDTGGYLETERKQDDPSRGSHNQAVSMTAEGSQSSDDDQLPVEASQRGKTIMPPSAINKDPIPEPGYEEPEQPKQQQNQSDAGQPADAPTLADIDAENRGQDAARSEIEQALDQGPEQSGASAPAPASKSLPPMPDFSTLPELPLAQSGEMDGFIPTPLPHQSQQSSQSTAAQPAFTNPQPVFSQPNQAQFQPPVAAQNEAQQERNLADRLGDILPPAQPQQPQQPSPQPQKPQDPAQFQLPS